MTRRTSASAPVRSSIMTRFARRSLARSRTRTMATIVGVALSCALICAVFCSATSLLASVANGIVSSEGGWYANAANATTQQVDQLASSGNVASALSVPELGAYQAQTPSEANDDIPLYLVLRGLPRTEKGSDSAAFSLAVMPDVTEGALPTDASQVALRQELRGRTLDGPDATSDGPLGIGSTITVNVGGTPVTLTVCGFLSSSAYFVGNDISVVSDDWYGGDSLAGIVGTTDSVLGAGHAAVPARRSVWADFTGYGDKDAVLVAMLDVFAPTQDVGNDLPHVALHDILMDYRLVRGSSGTWDSLAKVAVIVAVVIAVASVVLIRDSFAISVASRLRQFGLLRSMGASSGQIRREVITESLAIGLVAIPAGILLGLAGTAVTFALARDGIASLAGGEASDVQLSVSPAFLALTAAFELVVLLASAAGPALRASRVSPVEAVRSTATEAPSRAIRREAARNQRRGALVARPHGLLPRMAGVAGLMAQRNLRRESSHTRTIVASLAAGVALLMLTGSLSNAMTPITQSNSHMAGVDVELEVSSAYQSQDDTHLHTTDYVYAGIEGADDFVRRLTDGVEGLSAPTSVTLAWADASLPAGSLADGGSYTGNVAVYVPSADLWQQVLAKAGAGASTQVLALGTSGFDYAEDGFQVSLVVLPEDYDGIQEGDDGLELVSYDADGAETRATLAEAHAQVLRMEDVRTADKDVADLLHTSGISGTPCFVVSPEFLAAHPSALLSPERYYYFAAEDSPAATRQIQDNIDRLNSGDWNYYLADVGTILRETRMQAQTLQLFLALFALIMMLIAASSVFGTLASSVILRSREFAMLRSVGMGQRQFRRMLACECLAYGAWGLGAGYVAASLVGLLLARAMASGFGKVDFVFPWAWAAASAGLVAALLAASVAYALRRSHATSIVDGLRAAGME